LARFIVAICVFVSVNATRNTSMSAAVLACDEIKPWITYTCCDADLSGHTRGAAMGRTRRAGVSRRLFVRVCRTDDAFYGWGIRI